MGRVTTFPVHIRQGIWKGDPVDFCSYTTHAGSEAWAKILAKAWQDWLKGASKCGMLTYDLSEHE